MTRNHLRVLIVSRSGWASAARIAPDGDPDPLPGPHDHTQSDGVRLSCVLYPLSVMRTETDSLCLNIGLTLLSHSHRCHRESASGPAFRYRSSLICDPAIQRLFRAW